MKKIWFLSMCCACMLVGISNSYGDCGGDQCQYKLSDGTTDCANIGEVRPFKCRLGSGGVYSLDHVKVGDGENHCDAKCKSGVFSNWWYYTLQSDACEDGWKVDFDKKICVAADNQKCKYTDGTFAQTGVVRNKGNCIFASLEHIKNGGKGQCKNTCKSDGWYSELHNDACEDGWLVSADKKSCWPKCKENQCVQSVDGKKSCVDSGKSVYENCKTGDGGIDSLEHVKGGSGWCTVMCVSGKWGQRELRPNACESGYVVAANKKSCVAAEKKSDVDVPASDQGASKQKPGACKENQCISSLDGSCIDSGTSFNDNCNTGEGGIDSLEHVKDGGSIQCTVTCVSGKWGQRELRPDACESGYVVAADKKSCVADDKKGDAGADASCELGKACKPSSHGAKGDGICIKYQGDTVSCAATACDTDNGYHLVKQNGQSMGWCQKCKKDEQVNATGDGCVSKSANGNCPYEDGTSAQTGDVVNDTNCVSVNLDHVTMGGKDRCKSTCKSNGWDYELHVYACESGYVVADDKKSCVEKTTVAAEKDINPTETLTDSKQVTCGKIIGAQWIDGECRCTTAGWVMNATGTQCVKGEALIKAERLSASRTNISRLYKKLDSMSNDFKVSVWRDKQGNFNTSRLASDSIAAVVLGTTGALVTSSVVKKNQVSSGFEGISCQIGGQTVAGWGDEFSVGMQ